MYNQTGTAAHFSKECCLQTVGADSRLHILVFRRLALLSVLELGTLQLSNRRFFFERWFTGEPEERAAGLRFLFSLWIQ